MQWDACDRGVGPCDLDVLLERVYLCEGTVSVKLTVWLSPCSPSTQASIELAATPTSPANFPRNRAESKNVPLPMTCVAGKPEYECAKYVRTSTGLATSSRMAVSLMGFMSPITLDRMAWLRPIRSVRDSPGNNNVSATMYLLAHNSSTNERFG